MKPPGIITRRSVLSGTAALGSVAAGTGTLVAPLAAVSPADNALVSAVEKLTGIEQEIKALVSGRPEDCEDIPGFLELDERRFQLIATIRETPAVSLAGLQAKARAFLIPTIGGHTFGDYEEALEIARALSRELLALELQL